MKNKDVDDAIPILVLWTSSFALGMVVASEKSKAIGILMMISSILIAMALLLGDYRASRKQERIDKMVEFHKIQLEEAMRSGERETIRTENKEIPR